MDINYKIYSLKDPITNKIRYIGLTKKELSYRLCRHLCDKRINHRTCWLKSLKIKGLKPIIELIEENIESLKLANSKEVEYIKLYKELGFKLVNSTNGGDGTKGYIPSLEQRIKSSIRNKGVIPPNKGKKIENKEVLLKMSNAKKGIIGKKANRSIPVLQYSLDGIFIKEWDNAAQIQRELKISFPNILRVCYGQRNHAGGFKWKQKTKINDRY